MGSQRSRMRNGRSSHAQSRMMRFGDDAPRLRSARIAAMVESLTRLIRDIPDFPKPGIVFRDITPLLADPSGMALAIEMLANPFRGKHVDLVIGAESRGFIFGTAVAMCLSAGFGLVRKPGKLPFSKV